MTWFIHIWHDSFKYDMTHSYLTWLIHMWHDSFIYDMTHSYMWHDSFIYDMTHSYMTWLIHIWYLVIPKRRSVGDLSTWLIYVWHDSFMCDMTHSYMIPSHSKETLGWRFVDMTHFICDMTHSCVAWSRLIHMWHDSFMCGLTHSYLSRLIHVWHDPSICETTHSYMTWRIHMCHDAFICVTTDSLMVFSRSMVSSRSTEALCLGFIDMKQSYVWTYVFVCNIDWFNDDTLSFQTGARQEIHRPLRLTFQNAPLKTNLWTWLNHMRDMVHSYLSWRDYMCGVAHSGARGDGAL